MQIDVYGAVCREVPLCPRPVPSPLGFVTLLDIAQLEPSFIRTLAKIGKISSRHVKTLQEALDKIHDYLENKVEKRACAVCGSTRNLQVDEDWRYYMHGGEAEAKLVNVYVLCENCYNAKYLSSISLKGQDRVTSWLAEVNNLNLREARNLIKKVLTVWRNLSGIRKWKFRLEYLQEKQVLTQEEVKVVEELMSKLVHLNIEAERRGGLLIDDKVRIVNRFACLLKVKSVYKSSDIIRYLLREDIDSAYDKYLDKVEELNVQVNEDLLFTILDNLSQRLRVIEKIEENMVKIVELGKVCDKRGWDRKTMFEVGISAPCRFIEENMESLIEGTWRVKIKLDYLPDVIADLVKNLREDHMFLLYAETGKKRSLKRERTLLIKVPSILDVETCVKIIENVLKVVSKYTSETITAHLYVSNELTREKQEEPLMTYAY